ncbi:helix-turn-helix domain-containing protein [Arthrobacter sp. NyZ413]|uniref:helix-turn-helix transcriptional regulator n=1 Tax=Arthrobacter sp. NyZ413 TaxID=3144669 RepID=UPI003BF7A734
MALPTPEEMVAVNLERLRTDAGLTYEGLAQKLMGMGIRIHPSAIQKTEKSGRKATIKEMLAYARVFKIPVEKLWGGYAPSEEVTSAHRDLAAAETILKISKQVRHEYELIVESVCEQAVRYDVVRQELEGVVVQAAFRLVLEERFSKDDKRSELSIVGWEQAADLLGELEGEIPIDVETALDCLERYREKVPEVERQRASAARKEEMLARAEAIARQMAEQGRIESGE